MVTRNELIRRLREYSHWEDGCRIWDRTKNPKGYGQIRVGDKTMQAHRVAYMLVHGSAGPKLHHTCETPACINPEHLEETTQMGHALIHYGSTEERCRRGHLRTDYGFRRPDTGTLTCSACDRERARLAYQRDHMVRDGGTNPTCEP